MRMNLPNLDELLFRIVCAFPKDSKIGFALRICWERLDSGFAADLELGVSEGATAARY